MVKSEIKKALIDMNLTQTEFAKQLGMTRQNLHRILSEKDKWHLHEHRILRALGLDKKNSTQDSNNQDSCHQQQA